MLEVFTNPITLLCLGVVFLLISILFFYFKRSISLLERAQMEQARILQSFITNMEMSQHMALHRGGTQGANNRSISTEPATLSTQSSDQRLIDVSDEDNDSDSSGDDSDDDDDDESDDDEESMNDDTPNNEIVSIVSSKIPIIEIDELEHDSDNNNDNNNDIKVIQLPENTLEEFNPEVLDMNTLSWLDKRVNKHDDHSDSDDNSSVNDSIADSIQSLSEEEQQIVDEVKKEKIPIADYKTLSVQTLRQIAEDNELIKKGEKKTKKELLSLLENTKK